MKTGSEGRAKRASPILDVLQGRRPKRLPIWFMRQAGRLLPEYRKLREGRSFLELMRNPELAAEVTLMPMKRFDVDAAILFTDLLTQVLANGNKVAFQPGPVLSWTVKPGESVEPLRCVADSHPFEVVAETVQRVREALDPERALLGFVGAPFTLGAYAIEGQGSRTWNLTRSAAWRNPDWFMGLMDALVEPAIALGKLQFDHGCDGIQVFDSWAGVMEPALFSRLVLPALRKLVKGLQATGVPVIYFVNGCAGHISTMIETGADCLGVDWRLPMEEIDRRLPQGLPIQGNLDPTSLFGDLPTLFKAAETIVEAAKGRPHIFNLGHGFDPKTPFESVQALVQHLRSLS
jgi:uroporphyrinogen decarboxylase